MKSNFVFIAALFVAACGAEKTDNAASETAGVPETRVRLDSTQLRNAGILLGQAETAAVPGILRLNGAIDVPPQSMVSVSFPLGGYLRSSQLLPGMHVRKGQVLAVLEDQQIIQLQQDYLLAQTQLRLLENELNRQQTLNAGKASSDKVLEQAKADWESQKITLRALAEKLRLIGINPEELTEARLSRSVSLRSPIDGFVSKVAVNIGKYTAPTDVLFELVNPDDIHLNLTVFEKDLHSLAIGQKVLASTSDAPERKYPAEIILISRNLGPDRSAEVHCHFEKYDHQRLLPGMFMNAEVAIRSGQGLVVPESAVVRWENQHYIFTELEPGFFQLEPVEIGAAHEGRQEIRPKNAGSLNGRRVVLHNAYALLMKIKNSAEE
ncbi:MAG: efflux RND transporter periplasmic adaptor subunit [Saprospiraceae bacterium]|nr:efflux RND transporter periplasmic adaptor subunit [Saprospiraceae bacterium]